MNTWIEKAKEMGFDTAVPLDPGILTAREDVRAMCAADKCGAYGKNWTCPPACGTVEECQNRMRQYRRGILLQSVGHMTKTIDSKSGQRFFLYHAKAYFPNEKPAVGRMRLELVANKSARQQYHRCGT